jgi:uncharacterized protein (TIRG00374 family)
MAGVMGGWWPRQVRRVGMVLAFAIVVEYLVLPQVAGTRNALELLGDVDVRWIAAGVALEVAAILAYAELTRSLTGVRFLTSVRITLSTLGLSHVVPGGSVAGMSLGFRMLTRAGVDGHDAGFALATQGLGSALVLNVLLWVGLVISIPLRGFNPLYGTAAVVGALLLGLLGMAVLLLTRGEEATARLVCRIAARVPLLSEDRVGDFLHRVADRLQELLQDRRLLVRAGGWAAANWLLDAASLWVFLAAFGHRMGPDGLIVSYGIAYVLAAIPITPGGLGVIEAVLASMLVAFGAPSGEALLAVVSYRLVNFWLPIPVGALAYVSLRMDRRFRDEVRDVLA